MADGKLRAYNELIKSNQWAHRKHYPLNEKEKYWLLGSESLTQQLIDDSENKFKVIVLKEKFEKPFHHEALKLGISLSKVAKIREVELQCNDKVAVFARSVIPLEALKGHGLKLANLGNKPLGHLLFKRANVDLETREIGKRSFKQQYQRWARRTLYELNSDKILVSEFFLFRLDGATKTNNS